MAWTSCQSGSNGCGEKWSVSSYVFEPTGLNDGLNIGCEEKGSQS